LQPTRNQDQQEADNLLATKPDSSIYCRQRESGCKSHTRTEPREVIDKFKTVRMVAVQLPTTDGRELRLLRCPPKTGWVHAG
jgi:hypothetical protein